MYLIVQRNENSKRDIIAVYRHTELTLLDTDTCETRDFKLDDFHEMSKDEQLKVLGLVKANGGVNGQFAFFLKSDMFKSGIFGKLHLQGNSLRYNRKEIFHVIVREGDDVIFSNRHGILCEFKYHSPDFGRYRDVGFTWVEKRGSYYIATFAIHVMNYMHTDNILKLYLVFDEDSFIGVFDTTGSSLVTEMTINNYIDKALRAKLCMTGLRL